MTRVLFILISVLLFITNVKVGYADTLNVYQHILFPFCHANIFHLICNIIALSTLKGRLYFLPAYIICLMASFLPILSIYEVSEPTMGLSGVICALIGISWGKYLFFSPVNDEFHRNIRRFNIFVVLPLIICFFIPGINWSLHFYSITMGILYGGTLFKSYDADN